MSEEKACSRVFKRSTSKLIRGFVMRLLIIFVAFNWVAFLITVDFLANYLAVHLLATALSIALSVYLVFYRRNITIEVTDKAIRFMRGGSLQKEYAHLAFADYEFTSHVNKGAVSLFGYSGTSRWLHATNKSSGRLEPCRCDFLTKDTFHEFITHVLSPNRAQAQRLPMDYQFTFAVFTREEFLKESKKERRLLIIAAGIIAVNAGRFVLGAFAYDTFFVISMAISVLAILAFIGIKISHRRRPEKITLYSDRIAIDHKEFFYSDLRQVKATPPDLNREEVWTPLGRARVVKGFEESFDERILTLVQENGKTKTFVVGKVVDPEEEYANFCNELMKVFSDRFVWDLG